MCGWSFLFIACCDNLYLLLLWISRCSKLIAYMNLIKKVMLSNASMPYFGLYAQLSSVV